MTTFASGMAAPLGIVQDTQAGLLYVADYGNTIYRIVIATTAVTTITVSVPCFYLCIDSRGRYLYVATQHSIIRIDTAQSNAMVTLAGSSSGGYTDGIGAAARFSFPQGIALNTDETALHISDCDNNRIRQLVLSTRSVTTTAGSTAGYKDGAALTALFSSPYGAKWFCNATCGLLVADRINNAIRFVSIGSAPVISISQTATNTEVLSKSLTGTLTTATSSMTARGTRSEVTWSAALSMSSSKSMPATPTASWPSHVLTASLAPSSTLTKSCSLTPSIMPSASNTPRKTPTASTSALVTTSHFRATEPSQPLSMSMSPTQSVGSPSNVPHAITRTSHATSPSQTILSLTASVAPRRGNDVPDNSGTSTTATVTTGIAVTSAAVFGNDAATTVSLVLLSLLSCTTMTPDPGVTRYVMSMFYDEGPAAMAMGNTGISLLFLVAHFCFVAVRTRQNADGRAPSIWRAPLDVWGGMRFPALPIRFSDFLLPGLWSTKDLYVAAGAIGVVLVAATVVASRIMYHRWVRPQCDFLWYAPGVAYPNGHPLEALLLFPVGEWMPLSVRKSFRPLMAAYIPRRE